MKKFARYCYRCISCILSSLLLLSTGVLCLPIAAEEASDIMVKVFQSTSRYDMGIDCSNVRLGWSITSSRRALYQTAYHIVITDGQGNTAWDSGWVESGEQVGIVAQNLKPETIYTVKVRIKDETGRESAFSEGLVIETAPAEIVGEWLTSKRLVRETFTLEQPLANVERARCYMSSAVLIEPRLNGSKVGDLVWNPARTVFTEMTYYNTFDITDLLRDGENAVGAYTSTDYFISDYNLIGMLRIHYKDGSVQTVSTGEGWTTCAISEITGENALAGESIDARLVTDWDTPAFVETADWVPAASPMLRAHNGEVAIPAKADYRTLQSFSGDYSVELTATVTQRAFGLLLGAAEKETTPMMWQIVEGGLRLYWPDWIQIKTVSVPELTAGQRFTMKLDIRGNRITTYINGERVHSAAVPAGSTVGSLGVRTDDGEAAVCDQLTVTQDGQVIWEDRFDTADAEKWTFPRSPVIKPAISGSRVIEEFKPVSTTEIRKDGKTSYVLDFGQNMQGVVRMDTKGKAGTSYLIEYSELVDEKTGDIWAATTYHYPNSTYTLSGGEDTFMPRFFYCGFRYVKVTASDGSAIDPDDFTACFLSEDLDQTGNFSSSNERLNQIYEMYLRTQKSCIIGSVYAGCPGREKVCWTGDASVTKEAVLLSMSDIHGSEACMELMWHNIQPSGAPINLMFHTKLAAEDDNWDYAWTSAYFVFPYEVYMTTGDTYYIEKNYKQMLELFDFYTKVRNTNREHIKIGRATDWLGYDNQEHLVDYSYLDTAYYYYNGKLLSEMLEVIGVDHSELDARLEEIRDAIQETFYDERGYYHGKTQTENAMALDLGVVPEEHADAVLNSLVSACNRANKTLRTGVLGTKSLYDALSQANQHKLLLDMTLNPKKCSFGYFLDNGATTFLEHWDVAGETFFSHNTPILAQLDSQNHVMFGGGLATWMYEGLGGITNSGAGYTTSTFRPGIESGLESASASVTALVGKLSSDWRMENGDLVWNIEVPANTTATVIIPMASAKSITESGQNIFMKNGDGITYVGQNDSGDFVYTVGGGSYTFRASETPLAETDPQDTEPADTKDVDTDAVATDPAGTDAPTDSSEETKASRSGCASAMSVSAPGTLGALGAIAAAPALMKKRAKKKAGDGYGKEIIMKKLFLSLTLALLLILSISVVACTKDPGGSEDTTAGDMTPTETVTDTEEGSVADTETSGEEDTGSDTEAPTEEVTTLPDEPESFISDVSSNAAGTVLNQTDLAPYFAFALNGGTYENTSWAYQLDGISEMYAPLYGKYAMSVNFSLGTEGPGYAFVRGTHTVLSTDATATQIGSFCETDGSESDMGGAGIYARIENGVLTLMLKVYDETAGSRVKNVYYSIECVGSELTLADDGETVCVLVNGITYATVKLSGSTSYGGLAQTEPATEFASSAEIALKDGRTDTLTNTLIDSDSNTQGGLAVRSGVICFSSIKVRTFSDVIIPDLDMAIGNTDITKMPDFKVSGVFSSHMVLQREQPIRIWGFSNAEGSTVTGTFGGETVTARVKHDGRWELTFAPQAYQTAGQTMTISDDRGHETVLEDILIGDVWFIAGQSNAELNVGPCMNYAPDFVAGADDNIRLFAQTQAYAASQQEACRTPQPDVINPAWTWQRADKRSVVRNFSALGYFFAKELIKDTDVPQGIVMIAAGGACLSELLPAELAREQRYTNGGLVCIGGYYNTLVYPFIGMPCKGMLFFQGESESGTKNLARKYAEEMTLLIRYERERWGQDFPLYYVQLSDYLAGGAAAWPYLDLVRTQQFDALQTIPDSTLIVSMDLGAPEGYSDWAHSPLKYELACRVAKVALAKEYGVGEESKVSSPMPVTATLSADKTQITVEFKNVADGLTVSGLSPEASIGKTVEGFSVGVYGRLKEVTATITSPNTVTIEVPAGVDPSQVNYACFVTVTPENATLYGSNGLPAPAFSLPIGS